HLVVARLRGLPSRVDRHAPGERPGHRGDRRGLRPTSGDAGGAGMSPPRSASRARKTKETNVSVTLKLDAAGKASVATGIPFLDHMLELMAVHGLFDLTVKASGDLEVDQHHTVEDLGLVLGRALDEALGDRGG